MRWIPHALKPSRPLIMPIRDLRLFIRRDERNLEAEKEAGAYEAARCIVEECSIRNSHQAMAKRAHPSSSTGVSSRKKAWREPWAEVPSQGASRPELGITESEEEEEVAPPLIRSRRSRGPITSEGVEVAEGPQSEDLLASLMTSGEGAKMQPGSISIMMPILRIPEPSPTTWLICGKTQLLRFHWFKYHLRCLKATTMILALSLPLMMPLSSHMWQRRKCKQ